MNNRTKFLIKNVGILTACNFASKILVFLLVPLYTSVLSTEDMGLYDIAVSTVSLLFPILTCNISDAVMRFLMDKTHSQERVALIGLKYILASICIFLFMLLVASKTAFMQQFKGIEAYIAVFYFFYVFYQFLLQLAKGYEKVSDMGIAGVLGTAIMIAANVLFLLVLRMEIKGFFAANILANAVPAIYLAFRVKIWRLLKFIGQRDRELQKQMMLYCVPLIATVLGWWVNGASDRYVVTILCGLGANGLLSVAYKIPSIINTLQTIFVQAWQISAIKEYDAVDSPVFYGRAFAFINTLMVWACSVLIVLTKPLAHLLYAKDFYAAWEFAPFLLISCVLNSASGFLGPILSAKKDSRSMAMSAVYGAFANVVLNIVLVYRMGVQGATIATAIASYIIYHFRKNAVKQDIIIARYGRVLLSWSLLCIQAVLEIYTSLWGLGILLMLVIFVVNKECLQDLLKATKLLPKDIDTDRRRNEDSCIDTN